MAKKEREKPAKVHIDENEKNSLPIRIEEIEQSLKEEKPEVLKAIKPQKRKEVLREISMRAVSIQRLHAGPLPTPEDLGMYDQIIPSGAERIMVMAENQQNHRISLEKKVIRSQNFQSILGQFMGFFLGIIGIGTGAYLAIEGHDTVGSIIAGTTVVSLVSVFVAGRRMQDKKD